MQVYFKIFLTDIILTTDINTTDSRKRTNLLDIIFNYCYKNKWNQLEDIQEVAHLILGSRTIAPRTIAPPQIVFSFIFSF